MRKNKKLLISLLLTGALIITGVSLGVVLSLNLKQNNNLNENLENQNPDHHPPQNGEGDNNLQPGPEQNPGPEVPPEVKVPENIEDFFNNFNGANALISEQNNFFNKTQTFKNFSSRIISSEARNVPPKSTLEAIGFDASAAFPYPGNREAVAKLQRENPQKRRIQYDHLVERANFAFQENLANNNQT